MSQHAGKFTRKVAAEYADEYRHTRYISVRALRRCFRNASAKRRRLYYKHPETLVALVEARMSILEKNKLKAKVRNASKMSRGQSKLAAAWARARKILTNEKKGGRRKA